MGASLYYESKRNHQITQQEQATCQKIVQRYCTEYPFKKKTEDFCVYEVDNNTDIIFSGSTKLPNINAQFMFDVANYWLKCLTEISNTLNDGQWTVTYENVNLVLDKNEGWRFPTDDEYHQQMSHR